MTRLPASILISFAPALLGGCLAKTALDVATAPVRVAGRAVDLATTSQAEEDQRRGRELREQEERLGELARKYDKQRRRCDDGDRDSCEEAREIREEVDALRPR